MLHMPGILPCISFRIITTCTFRMSYITGIKRRFPYPVSITRTHKVSLRIEQVLIIISTFRKVSGIFFFSHTTCHVSCRIIIIYRFQGWRYGLCLCQVCREISVLRIHFPIRLQRMRYGLRLLHHIESTFSIKAMETFAVSLGNDRYTMIANHTEVFFSP